MGEIQTEKKSTMLSFRVSESFRTQLDQLSVASGWSVTEIARIGLTVFWADIASLALTTLPTETPQEIAANRELAKLFRAARAHGLDLRAVLTKALEDTLAEQTLAAFADGKPANGQPSGQGSPLPSASNFIPA